MKKLLILMLVLGLTSVIYGDIRDNFELVLDEGTDILTVVGLVPNVSFVAGIYLEPPSATAAFSDATILTGTVNGVADRAYAGSLADIELWEDAECEGITGMIVGSTGLEDPAWPVDAVNWFTVKYTGNVDDVVQVYETAAEVYVGPMTIIPEPMTIALLGLGGLFLLRRRK